MGNHLPSSVVQWENKKKAAGGHRRRQGFKVHPLAQTSKARVSKDSLSLRGVKIKAEMLQNQMSWLSKRAHELQMKSISILETFSTTTIVCQI